MSVQSERKNLTTLPQIRYILVFGDRTNKEGELDGVGQSSCATLRNSVQHTFERDLGCRSSKL